MRHIPSCLAALALAAVLAGRPASAQEATPAFAPVPDPSECRARPSDGTPRPLPTGEPRAALATAAPGDGIPALGEAELPAGPAAPAAAVAGATETVRQVIACSAAEDASASPPVAGGPGGTPPAVAEIPDSPVLALYTDDYFRRATTTAGGGLAAWAPPPSTFRVAEARLLPDARVGAVVEGSAFAPVFLVFAEEDGRWLIDEWVILAGAEDGAAAATPSSSSS